jgi:hypothetical protein
MGEANEFVFSESLMTFRSSVLCVVAFLAYGCTHVIHVPTECGPPEEPIGHSAIGWERAIGPARITGRVVSPTSSAIQGATIGLTRLGVSPSRDIQAFSGQLGEFSFDSTPPSRYLMLVRRLGYGPARDTIEVRSDSSVVVVALLAQHRMILDECTLTYTEKRVPWWKH